jgi:heat shock protein HtpX
MEYFSPKTPAPPKEKAAASDKAQPIDKSPAPKPGASAAPSLGSPATIQTQPGKSITVDTPLYTAVFDTSGARLKSWKVKKYLDKIGEGAKPIDLAEAPEVYAALEELAARGGIPVPRLYLIDSDSPNAFATGRNPRHAAVAVTKGIVRILDREELKGVLAHELSHVRNRDILIGSVAATLAGVIMMLANMARWAAMFGGGIGGRDNDRGGGNALGLIVMSILAPLAAMLIQMAISRSREYLADASGAHLTGNPYSLASALEKLQMASQRVPMREAGTATAHMFIVNPLSGRTLMNLFSTHPPIEERVRRLRGLA